MNQYEHQRPRLFIDLSPRSLRFNIFKVHFLRNQFVSFETAQPIDAKLHMEPPWDGGMKVCQGPGHMTSMATMPIYGIKLKKSSLKPKGLKVGMQHRVLEY